MQHHDLARRCSRIWPMDPTILRRSALGCTIHHKQASREHWAHRAHIHGNHLNSWSYSSSCFTLPLETMCKPFQPVFNPNDGCHVSFEFIFTIKCKSTVEWCFHDGCETLSRHHWASQHQTDVSLQLTPVPTYTSVSVLSHLRVFCDA